MRQHAMDVVNHLLSLMPAFILIGVVHLIFIERKSFILLFKKGKRLVALKSIAARFLYIVAGVVLVVASFAIVNKVLEVDFELRTASSEATSLYPDAADNIQPTGFWAHMRDASMKFGGLIAAIGFIISGISLILSAGGRWLVNLSKLFATLSFLYLLLMMFALAL